MLDPGKFGVEADRIARVCDAIAADIECENYDGAATVFVLPSLP
jgi:hypothetical protein